jgi:predicted dinucleotide-binding enzyme
MKIGILGSGGVGQSLGLGFAGLGDEVKIGSRTPGKDELKAWRVKAGPKASTGTFAEAAAFGETLILATRWTGTENAIRLANPANFAGKVLIDATNPLSHHENGLPGLAVGCTNSAGEEIQRWLPRAKVVKALNIINAAFMVKPEFPGGPPDMFICGNDAEAKRSVAAVLERLGWPPPIDMGGIEESRPIEALALLYIHHALRTGTWGYAFKLLKK